MRSHKLPRSFILCPSSKSFSHSARPSLFQGMQVQISHIRTVRSSYSGRSAPLLSRLHWCLPNDIRSPHRAVLELLPLAVLAPVVPPTPPPAPPATDKQPSSPRRPRTGRSPPSPAQTSGGPENQRFSSLCPSTPGSGRALEGRFADTK